MGPLWALRVAGALSVAGALAGHDGSQRSGPPVALDAGTRGDGAGQDRGVDVSGDARRRGDGSCPCVGLRRRPRTWDGGGKRGRDGSGRDPGVTRRTRVWDTRLFPQCREVRKRNSSERCRFLRGTPDCRLDDGFLDYLGGAFCAFPAALLPLPVGLYVSVGTGGGGRAAPAGRC